MIDHIFQFYGSFQGAVNYDAGDSPWFVAIGDLNGDANPELAVANYLSDTVSILINTGGYGDELAIDYGALCLWDVDTISDQ